jgi:predicted trehalose synthase
LTDVSPYPHIAPVLGALQFCDEAGRPTALAVLQRYVHNQGSGWNYVIEYLHRYLDQQLTLAPDEVDTAAAAADATTAEGSATASPASIPKSSPIATPARGAAAAPAPPA